MADNSDVVEFTKYENSCLVGYYGGLNFGDELLLDCLQLQLLSSGIKNVEILYQGKSSYKTYHADYKFKITERTPLNTLIAFMRHRNIIVGGGGHWGLDANKNVFLLSLLLLLYRLLNKNIVLLGVGYYDSTNKLGHVSAWLAGKAAKEIYARDDQSFRNFSKISSKTQLWQDIAESIHTSQLNDVQKIPLLEKLQNDDKNSSIALVTLRRFKPGNESLKKYLNSLYEYLTLKPKNNAVLIVMCESESMDSEGYKTARELAAKFTNVHMLEYKDSSIKLYAHLLNDKRKLRIRAIQYHILLCALKSGINDIWNVSYDYKCTEILKKFHYKSKTILDVSLIDFEGSQK